MTLWRCSLMTSTNQPDVTTTIKSKDLNMRSVFAWGQVWRCEITDLSNILLNFTFFLPEFVMTLTHNGLFATFLNSGEVCFLQRNRPICPNLLFPVFSQNKPSNGNTLLYNHVLASQGLHLHNWGTAYWTSKLCAVTLAAEWDDSHWIIFFMGLFLKHI